MVWSVDHLGGENLSEHLASMTKEFNRWCQSQKIRTGTGTKHILKFNTGFVLDYGLSKVGCSSHTASKFPLGRHYQHPICSALLTVKQGEFPELRIKAWAGRVLIVFLQHKIAELINNKLASGEGPNEVLIMVNAVLTSISQWFALVEKAGRYLTEEEANTIWGTSLEILGISRLKTFCCVSLWLGCLCDVLVHAQKNVSNEPGFCCDGERWQSGTRELCSFNGHFGQNTMSPGLDSSLCFFDPWVPLIGLWFSIALFYQTVFTWDPIWGISRDQCLYEDLAIQLPLRSLLYRWRYAGHSQRAGPACPQTIDGTSGDGTISVEIEDPEEKNLYPSPFIVEKDVMCGDVVWVNQWNHTLKSSHVKPYFRDFFVTCECRCFGATEGLYGPMLFPEPTLVNVDPICIRSIPWECMFAS